MANTVSFSKITNEEIEFVGTRKERVVTLTVVSNGSDYVTGGISDSTNFPDKWERKLGLEQVVGVEFRDRPVLRISDLSGFAYPFEIDLTNRKVILFALPATPAEAEGLAEHKTATALPAGTYTAKIKLIARK